MRGAVIRSSFPQLSMRAVPLLGTPRGAAFGWRFAASLFFFVPLQRILAIRHLEIRLIGLWGRGSGVERGDWEFGKRFEDPIDAGQCKLMGITAAISVCGACSVILARFDDRI
jgi:hypothetical protein